MCVLNPRKPEETKTRSRHPIGWIFLVLLIVILCAPIGVSAASLWLDPDGATEASAIFTAGSLPLLLLSDSIEYQSPTPSIISVTMSLVPLLNSTQEGLSFSTLGEFAVCTWSPSFITLPGTTLAPLSITSNSFMLSSPDPNEFATAFEYLAVLKTLSYYNFGDEASASIRKVSVKTTFATGAASESYIQIEIRLPSSSSFPATPASGDQSSPSTDTKMSMLVLLIVKQHY
jgi:hypothetical protein